jgi:hypothetical protein
MKRVLFVPVLVAAVIGVVAIPVDAAGPPNKTTITLVCDRDTLHADASVTLSDAGPPNTTASADAVLLACGTDVATRLRSVQVTTFAVGFASIDAMTVDTELDSVPCSASGTLPLKANCSDADGTGATVVVR